MDPIANFLTVLRNAAKAGLIRTYAPYSEIKFSLATILEKNGYITNLKKIGKAPKFRIRCDMVYKDDLPRLEIAKRLSKPSRRLYINAKTIKPRVFGFNILSTPHGIMTDRDAKKKNCGGELICYIR